MSDEVEYDEEMAELGLKDGGEEVAVALWGGAKEKYAMKNDFDEDSLTYFIEVHGVYIPPLIVSCNTNFTLAPYSYILSGDYAQCYVPNVNQSRRVP